MVLPWFWDCGLRLINAYPDGAPAGATAALTLRNIKSGRSLHVRETKHGQRDPVSQHRSTVGCLDSEGSQWTVVLAHDQQVELSASLLLALFAGGLV